MDPFLVSFLSPDSLREQDARYRAMTRQAWTAASIAIGAVIIGVVGLWWGGWW